MRRVFLTIVLMGGLFPKAAGACPVTAGELQARAEAVLQAPEDQFDSLHDALLDDLGCASEPVGPGLAAELHRLEALATYGRRELDQTRAALRAATAAAPDSTFDEAIVPPGHLLRRLEDEARRLPDPIAPLDVPGEQVPWVDGQVSTVRPTSRPAVVQLVDLEGQPTWGGLLRPGEDLPGGPPEPLAEAPAQPARTLPSQPPSTPKAGRPWLMAAGGLGVAALGLGIGGLSARSSISATIDQDGFDPDLDMGEVEREQALSNGLGYAAQGTGALALGCATIGLVIRW